MGHYGQNVSMTDRVVPDKTQMGRYLSRGLTQAEIVEAWEKDSGIRCSRSAIAMAISRYGLKSSHPRPRYEDTLPWRVAVEHKNHWDARMLRLEGRRRLGKELTPEEKRLLGEWATLLEERNAVITYDPDTEQGFWWTYRTEEDDDPVVRRPRSQPKAS